MDQLLGILYNHIVQEEADFMEVTRHMETLIRNRTGNLDVEEQQKEEVKTAMYDFLCAAQEIYFKLGFQYGIRFMAEMQFIKNPEIQ